MRSLLTTAVLASVFGPFATTAFAADLDYPDAAPPPPFYEPRPVPPAYVPGPVPPVVVVPRAVVRPIRVYPRPYPYDFGPRPVVRVYGEPRPYAEGWDRPDVAREARPYPGPGYERGYSREADGVAHEDYGRGVAHEDYRHEDARAYRHEERTGYGHYLSREELEQRAERRQDHGRDARYADRAYADHARGYERDESFADREPGRDFDR